MLLLKQITFLFLCSSAPLLLYSNSIVNTEEPFNILHPCIGELVGQWEPASRVRSNKRMSKIR